MNDGLTKRASGGLIDGSLFGCGHVAGGSVDPAGFLRPEMNMGLGNEGLQQKTDRRDKDDEAACIA